MLLSKSLVTLTFKTCHPQTAILPICHFVSAPQNVEEHWTYVRQMKNISQEIQSQAAVSAG